MFEYAAVLHQDFRELFLEGINNVSNWLKAVPYYWYIIALVLFFVLVRLLTGKKR